MDLLVSVLSGYKHCGFWTQTDKQHVLNSVPRLLLLIIAGSKMFDCGFLPFEFIIQVSIMCLCVFDAAGAPDYCFQRLGYVFGLFGQAQVRGLRYFGKPTKN